MKQTEPLVTKRDIRTLANGMRALFLPSDANEIVAVLSFIPLPGAIESAGEAGLVEFMEKMLNRGTKKRSSAELAEAVDSLGSSISCGPTYDYSNAHMVCTSDTLEDTLALYSEVLTCPAFEPDEIEKERQSTLAAIRRQDDDKFSYTYKAFLRALYGDHSYGLPEIGYAETVREFRQDQLRDLHADFFNPSSFMTVAAGHFDPAKMQDLLERFFVRQARQEETYKIPPVGKPSKMYQRLTRDCEQAFLVMGYPGCSMSSADFFALRVMNAVLGEGMSSRFFVELRDRQGLAYATGCSMQALRAGGHIAGYIGTKPESLQTAREGMTKLFQAIREDLVPTEELERARNYVIGKFLIDHQTNYKRAYYLGLYETYGMGLGMDEEYPVRIGSVTAEQVREVANKYLTDDPVIVELVPRETSKPAAREN